MNSIIERLIPYIKSWLYAFAPGVTFAYFAEKLFHLEFATEYIIYDSIILFVIGKILNKTGSILIDLIIPIFTESDTRNIEKSKVPFSSILGIFIALILCWTGDFCLSNLSYQYREYFYLALVFLGFIASIVLLIKKIEK